MKKFRDFLEFFCAGNYRLILKLGILLLIPNSFSIILNFFNSLNLYSMYPCWYARFITYNFSLCINFSHFFTHVTTTWRLPIFCLSSMFSNLLFRLMISKIQSLFLLYFFLASFWETFSIYKQNEKHSVFRNKTQRSISS